MAGQRDPEIVAAAEDIADMARRITGNAGEPFYCGEKADRAARGAVRIIARTHVAREAALAGEGHHGMREADEAFASLVAMLRREWDDNIRWARHERAEGR